MQCKLKRRPVEYIGDEEFDTGPWEPLLINGEDVIFADGAAAHTTLLVMYEAEDIGNADGYRYCVKGIDET